MMNNTEELLRQAQAARYLNRSIRTLAIWRERNYGPPYLRIGGAVMYRTQDLHDFVESNRVQTNGSLLAKDTRPPADQRKQLLTESSPIKKIRKLALALRSAMNRTRPNEIGDVKALEKALDDFVESCDDHLGSIEYVKNTKGISK